VIGYDDVPQAATIIPPLTTARFPLDTVVEHMVNLLIAKLEKRPLPSGAINLKFQMVIRKSVADHKHTQQGDM